MCKETSISLIIIACGKSKIWDKHPDIGPTAARDAYTGSYFRANRRYAEAQGCDWMILSAKYGLIRSDFVIPGSYNVTFKDPSTHPVTAENMQAQVFKYQLAKYLIIVILGGQEYIEIAERALGWLDVRFETPFAGMSMGEQIAAIDQKLGETGGIQPCQPAVAVSGQPRKLSIDMMDSGPTGPPGPEAFRRALNTVSASSTGSHVDVTSGALHRAIGGYPGAHHAMPTCCVVMLAAVHDGDEILSMPPKGRGATLTIRYKLLR